MDLKTSSKMDVKSTRLEIEHEGAKHNNLHLLKAEIYTGDDNYQETDCVEILPALNNKLVVKQILNHKTKTPYRVRGELGVRLFVCSEDGELDYVVTLCHHKGSVMMSVSRGDK